MASSKKVHQYEYDQAGYILKVKAIHVKNFTQVNDSLQHANQQLRKAIASSNTSEISGSVLTFTRIYSMLLSVWCEARLHTLLYEDGVFNEQERAAIYNSGSVEERWKEALTVSVKKNSGLELEDNITEYNVDFSVFNIYKRITQWIKDYFSPVIRSRNKVAHAQWVTPFTNLQEKWVNSSSFKVCPDSIQDFNADNLLSIEEKTKMLSSIAGAINSLAIGGAKSDYKVQSFDNINDQVNKHILKLETIDYSDFATKIQTAYQKHNAK